MFTCNKTLPTLPHLDPSDLFKPRDQHLQVGVDERAERANARVHTRLASLGTALTPRNKANEGLGRVDNRTSRVTLARVLATSSNAGAEHVVRDLADAVVVAAGSARDDGNVDLAESGGRGTVFGQSSPAGDGAGAARGRVGARGGQAGVADGGTSGDAGGKLPDGDVVVEGRAGEAGMHLDGGDADEGSARVTVLMLVSTKLMMLQMSCLTYQASGTDGEGGSSLADSAVTGGDDSVGVEERTAAEVRAAALQTDDKGKVASRSNRSTDDVDRVLGGGSSGRCGGQQASDHCLVLHLDEVLGSEGSECWKWISEWMILLGR